jgi:biotin carboxylase
MDKQLADYWNYPLGLQYNAPEEAARMIRDFADDNPIGAILAVDDSGTVVASIAAKSLGIPHISSEAAEASRNKYMARQMLAKAGVRSPAARLFEIDPEQGKDHLARLAAKVTYPCVVKPLSLNGSQGVIRANTEQEFISAATRLGRLLLKNHSDSERLMFLVEQYIPGIEVALEGLMTDDRLKVLALFDKPDPLVGPYFEETIYVTPSRLPQELQEEITEVAEQAVKAIGLREGPIHAELRINDEGAWIIEVAGRSIGGLCSKTLRFGVNASLEEIILRNCFGMEIPDTQQADQASGVMMIPIPEAGLFKKVEGCEKAASVPLIEGVEITAKVNNYLTPLPDGESYLGFIFARGDSPENVESALRTAHEQLRFSISPGLPLLSSTI